MKPSPLRFPLPLLACLMMAVPGMAEPIAAPSPWQLERWLQQYPNADTNGDGVLTVEEAEAFRRKMEQPASGEFRPPRFRHEFTFFTASDGVKIALAVGFPKGFDAADTTRKWPTIFATSGYTNATMPRNPVDFADRYVTVSASIRGTGASGGQLSPWRPRTWQDGHEVIEDWIVKQPWSNGRVGIVGHSWPGLMGFLTATTHPPSLRAVCVSGLIDDFYRGIGWPGGVRNCGFSFDWLNNYYHPGGPFRSGLSAAAVRGLSGAEYQAIVASRSSRDLREDILWLVLHEPLDGPRWHARNLATHAQGIRAPILLGHTWQDEQTGPGGWQLWNRVPDNVPKRLALSNGHHAVSPFAPGDVQAWFDHWLLDMPDPKVNESSQRVECYFETRGEGRAAPSVLGSPLVAGDFPFPGTRWTRCYLRRGNALTLTPPEGEEAPSGYLVTHANQGGEGSRAFYQVRITEPTAIAGPIVLTLWAALTTLDTDFFVLLADQAPDGKLYGLQRGLLRASHREVDPQRSDYVESDGERLLVRPHHPHTRLDPVEPHEPREYLIEIPAVAHVFRPGHALTLILCQPPDGDPIGMTKAGTPSYRYQSHQPPGTVTIFHDAQRPSSLLLPVLPELPPLAEEAVPVGSQAGLQSVD